MTRAPSRLWSGVGRAAAVSRERPGGLGRVRRDSGRGQLVVNGACPGDGVGRAGAPGVLGAAGSAPGRSLPGTPCGLLGVHKPDSATDASGRAASRAGPVGGRYSRRAGGRGSARAGGGYRATPLRPRVASQRAAGSGRHAQRGSRQLPPWLSDTTMGRRVTKAGQRSSPPVHAGLSQGASALLGHELRAGPGRGHRLRRARPGTRAARPSGLKTRATACRACGRRSACRACRGAGIGASSGALACPHPPRHLCAAVGCWSLAGPGCSGLMPGRARPGALGRGQLEAA